MNTTLVLSSNTLNIAGILLLTIVAIEYGGWFMLRVVQGRQPKQPPLRHSCRKRSLIHCQI